MKSYAEYLLLLDGDALIPQHELELLAGALLDGGIPDVELGALLATVRRPFASGHLLRSLLAALDTRVTRWRGDDRHRPVVIGCYGGAVNMPNLAPLLGLLLARFDVPVLMHGPLHADQGVSTALVLRELGIMPCAQTPQVAEELATRRLAFVPDALAAPGLAALLALRPRLGPLPLLVTAARLIDPFDCGALVIAGADSDDEIELMRGSVATNRTRVLLLRATEGEAFANPFRRPRMEYWESGEQRVLFDAAEPQARRAAALPAALDVRSTAAWLRQACDGVRAVPTPIVNQLAACLHAVGYCDDFNQAKALAAIATTRRHVA
ncbi:MAG: DNA-binding protein YbiB [Burkholderiales bacterium]